MNNKLLVWMFVFLFFSSFAYAVVDDAYSYWSFNNVHSVGNTTAIDRAGTHNGTGSGTTAGYPGLLNEAWEIGKTDEIVVATAGDQTFLFQGGTGTFSAWINVTNTTATQRMYFGGTQ